MLVFPPLLPLASLLNEADASAAHAMLLGRAKAPALQGLYAELRVMPEFLEAAPRTASVHVSGVSHVMLDAGSRG